VVTESRSLRSVVGRASVSALWKLLGSVKSLEDKMIERAIIIRRRQIERRMGDLLGHRVAYGPFRGLQLGAHSWWGVDRAGMLLGLYEKEILDRFDGLPASHRTFIDLGAADGYYALGALVSDRFDHCYCYEACEQALERLAQNARLNQVADRLSILGLAKPDFWKDLQGIGVDLSKAVMVVDIEGGEFNLLDSSTLEAFRGAVIFVELHEFFRADGREAVIELKRRAEKHFRIEEFSSGPRDLSNFPEISTFRDDDRWLICSEGRPRPMTWLRLDGASPPHACDASLVRTLARGD
jgi:hypothetical protein